MVHEMTDDHYSNTRNVKTNLYSINLIHTVVSTFSTCQGSSKNISSTSSCRGWVYCLTPEVSPKEVQSWFGRFFHDIVVKPT